MRGVRNNGRAAIKCPKCKADSEVTRTTVVPKGKRRARRCLSPRCGTTFVTTETVHDAFSPNNKDATERMVACLKDGRGYDREAIEAALRTDARRAEIERARRAEPADDGYDAEYAPSRLSFNELKRELGR